MNCCLGSRDLHTKLPAGDAHAGPLRLLPRDIESAREGFAPASSWGVAQAGGASGAVSGWEDVGGLHDVVAALKEALELPLKHARLIARCATVHKNKALERGDGNVGRWGIVSDACCISGT